MKKRAVVLASTAVASWLISQAVWAATTSSVLRIVVDLIMIVWLGWVGVTFCRVLLRESQDAAKKNPRPW